MGVSLSTVFKGWCEQNGFQDEKSGNLFYHILKVLRYHKPNFPIMDNIPNFTKYEGTAIGHGTIIPNSIILLAVKKSGKILITED